MQETSTPLGERYRPEDSGLERMGGGGGNEAGGGGGRWGGGGGGGSDVAICCFYVIYIFCITSNL